MVESRAGLRCKVGRSSAQLTPRVNARCRIATCVPTVPCHPSSCTIGGVRRGLCLMSRSGGCSSSPLRCYRRRRRHRRYSGQKRIATCVAEHLRFAGFAAGDHRAVRAGAVVRERAHLAGAARPAHARGLCVCRVSLPVRRPPSPLFVSDALSRTPPAIVLELRSIPMHFFFASLCYRAHTVIDGL